MTKDQLIEKIKTLEQQLEEANKTIDEMAQFNSEVDYANKEPSFFSCIIELIKGWFTPPRPFKDWEIGVLYITSPCGKCIYEVDTYWRTLKLHYKSKSKFFPDDQRNYFYKLYEKELGYRMKEQTK